MNEYCESNRAEELLHSVTEGTAAVTGADFFQKMVRHIASALNLRYVFVTECTDADNSHVRALAFWNGETFCNEVAYDVKYTPCRRVVEGEICSYPENVQSLFPEDKDLVNLAAEGYLAAPLFGAAGNVIGHLAVLDTKPMT